MAPVISIIGGSPVTQVVNTAYVDQGATAVDNVDGDITSKIITTSTVDISVVGSYSVNYSVTDMAGNTTVVTRIVNVAAEETPVITP
jgi:hypothetical protein